MVGGAVTVAGMVNTKKKKYTFKPFAQLSLCHRTALPPSLKLIMSSLASYKGPKPVQKPSINDIVEDEDDVLISADTLPEHGNAAGLATETEDMDTAVEKPTFAALKANEMAVSEPAHMYQLNKSL